MSYIAITRRVRRRLALGGAADGGFTLIELLVVIIIIAILAAIAIPTYMGQRERANDSSAYSLVRNALTAVQTAFVDTGDYTEITAAMLNDIEVSISFIEFAPSASGADLVAVSPPAIDTSVTANAPDGEVVFYAENRDTFDIASRSGSGNWFGIQVDCLDVSETGYVKVKIIDGSAGIGW